MKFGKMRFGFLGASLSVMMLLANMLVAGQELHPAVKIKTSGAVTDFLIEGAEVVLCTDAGTVETWNVTTGKRTGIITLPAMKDFMGDPLPTKIFSIDKLNDKMLLVTQGNHGFRNVLILTGADTLKLIDAGKDRMLVKKARFIGKDRILMATMSNEIILFGIESRKKIYDLSVSAYTFSDFDLSKDKSLAFTSDESGIVHKIDVAVGKIIEEYRGNNVDNVYKLVYRNGTVITAGQDRRVGIYRIFNGDNYYLQKDFLVYCVGLNGDGTTGAYSAREDNSICIFDIFTREDKYILTGHKSVVTKIAFQDDQTLISAGDDGYLMIWKIEK